MDEQRNLSGQERSVLSQLLLQDRFQSVSMTSSYLTHAFILITAYIAVISLLLALYAIKVSLGPVTRIESYVLAGTILTISLIFVLVFFRERKKLRRTITASKELQDAYLRTMFDQYPELKEAYGETVGHIRTAPGPMETEPRTPSTASQDDQEQDGPKMSPRERSDESSGEKRYRLHRRLKK